MLAARGTAEQGPGRRLQVHNCPGGRMGSTTKFPWACQQLFSLSNNAVQQQRDLSQKPLRLPSIYT